MEFSKKTIVILVLIFVLGILAGFYFGNKRQQGTEKTVQIPLEKTDDNVVCPTVVNNISSITKSKLDLLKSYTDFILLPPEKAADITKYTDDINNELEAINDSEITSRFEETLAGDDAVIRSQKANAFLDFLNDKIKADLQ